MLTEQELKQIADKLLADCKGYEAETRVSAGTSALTRFSDNVITQNVAGSTVGCAVRLMKDGKMGKAETGNLSDDGLKLCVRTAITALNVSAPDSDILPLPGPQTYQPKDNYRAETVDFSPTARAEGVKKAVTACEKASLVAAGIYTNSGSAMALANSNGLWAFNRRSNAEFSLSAMSADSSGWSQEGEIDVHGIDVDRIATKAIAKCNLGKNPVNVDPGAWTVVFEPSAVADFLLFLGWTGLNGKNFNEGRSCFSGKVGQKVVGENITLTDDAYHPMTPGMSFDYEGMPKRRVVMIENGIFLSPVHDRKSALAAGVEPTGHGLPQPSSEGAVPLNVVLSPGNSSLEEMIADTPHGLLVSRLHYSNILDPMKVMLTGMTRDGLFLIEKGKVTKGVKNLRYTESVLNVLSNIVAMSSQLYKTETFWGGGGTVVPAIKVRDFHFTSRTSN